MLLRTPLFALDPHSPPIKSLELLAHGYFIQHISRTELWSHAGVRVFRAQHIGKECAAKRSLYFIKSASLGCKAGVFCSANDIETIQSDYFRSLGSRRHWTLKLTNVLPLRNFGEQSACLADCNSELLQPPKINN